jgi:hypothetical protein
MAEGLTMMTNLVDCDRDAVAMDAVTVRYVETPMKRALPMLAPKAGVSR